MTTTRMTVRTRPPTGKAGWPNLLIEGKEKAGKTTQALRFTADPRVGAAYVVEVGERRADEYAAVGQFEIVEHDGSLREAVAAIRFVMAQAPRDGRPNVLIVDAATGLWDLVKRYAESIARSSRESQRILEADPNAEIPVGHQAWNRAKDTGWWSWLNELRAWPGIALLVARADEVSKFEGGRPVAGQTEYRVELESGTRFILDGQVRVPGPTHPLKVISAASLNFSVPADGLDLPMENPLGHLIFDLYKAGTEVVLDQTQAKRAVVGACVALGDHDDDDKASPAKVRAGRVWREVVGHDVVTFDAATMRKLLDAVAADVAANPPATDAPVAPEAPDGPQGADTPTRTPTGDVGHQSGDVSPPSPPDADDVVAVAEPTSPDTALDQPESPSGAPGAPEIPAEPPTATEEPSVAEPAALSPAEINAGWATVIDEVKAMSLVTVKARLLAEHLSATEDEATLRAKLATHLGAARGLPAG